MLLIYNYWFAYQITIHASTNKPIIVISPFFPFSCRYQPTCSEYFIDCLKLNGILKGTLLGIKRILRCHPIKILGGKDGFDPAPKITKGKK